MSPLDAIAAAGLVLRVAWLPSAQRYRATATRTPESSLVYRQRERPSAAWLAFSRTAAQGETATVAVDRLYVLLVTAGVVPHEETLPPCAELTRLGQAMGDYDLATELQEATAEADRGEGSTLTQEQVEDWARTGKLPKPC